MNPIVPGITSKPALIERTVKAIADHGARFVGCNVMFLEGGTRDHFMRWLEQEFPHMVEGYNGLYAGKYAPSRTAKKSGTCSGCCARNTASMAATRTMTPRNQEASRSRSLTQRCLPTNRSSSFDPPLSMQLIDALIATRDETVALFALDEEALARTYGPGKWSVRYVLHHIADAETVLFERIRRVISEGRRVIWAFDQEAWARGLDYSTRPMGLSRDLYLASRAGIIHYAALHYEQNGHLEWIHSTARHAGLQPPAPAPRGA